MIAIAENVNQSRTFCWTRTTSTGAAALATIAQRRDARVVRAVERAGSAILQVWVRAAMVPGASEWGPGRDRERENPPDETNVVPHPKVATQAGVDQSRRGIEASSARGAPSFFVRDETKNRNASARAFRFRLFPRRRARQTNARAVTRTPARRIARP